MPRKIRASKDEETQPPLTQRPGFIIGMTFLAVVAAFIISVLIFRFIQRRKRCLPTGDQGVDAQRGDQGVGVGVGFSEEDREYIDHRLRKQDREYIDHRSRKQVAPGHVAQKLSDLLKGRTNGNEMFLKLVNMKMTLPEWDIYIQNFE